MGSFGISLIPRPHSLIAIHCSPLSTFLLRLSSDWMTVVRYSKLNFWKGFETLEIFFILFLSADFLAQRFFSFRVVFSLSLPLKMPFKNKVRIFRRGPCSRCVFWTPQSSCCCCNTFFSFRVFFCFFLSFSQEMLFKAKTKMVGRSPSPIYIEYCNLDVIVLIYCVERSHYDNMKN